MTTNYEKIIRENLASLYNNLPAHLDACLEAEKKGSRFYLKAFGEECCIGPESITLSKKPVTGPRGLLITLYALQANPEPIRLEPFKAFKDLSGSMPYQGAFKANSELILVPHVLKIKDKKRHIEEILDGASSRDMVGDFSFILYPFPKIALCYIFYLPDDEFPSSVSCLLSTNALSFMPLDGLADVAEYTSKAILDHL